ncbi:MULTISPECIES: hypothetical protein [unclassified Microcoleus]|uniref:hypothetical protein n=1 Tax=unclassified Microcoleus TaxID=2642155 RepID=UPI0025DB136D|nr:MULTISPECIES: hypothetical protein [unclassified Microcoleus]
MQSSDNTLFWHFKYGLLQFLAKHLRRKCDRTCAETEFLGDNRSRSGMSQEPETRFI